MIAPSNSPKFVLRIPGDLKVVLERTAKSEGRSLNSELVKRLMDSLKRDGIEWNA